jgi:hypothetical protein
MASLNKSRLGKGAKHVHRERTVNFIQLWDEILTANVMKNNSNYGETRTKNMYVDMIGFYSGEDNVTYVYSIDGYPKELEISYRSTLRSACKAGVRISFVSPLEQYSIDWNSPQMKARLRTWRTLANEGVEVDEYNLHENLSDMDSQDWKKDSLVYLSTAEIRRKRKMFKFRSIMFISGQRGQDFNDSVKEIVNMCKTMNIKISRIIGDIPEYLKVFSPFSNTYDNKVLDQCGCITIPDELLSRFNTYAQGMIGREGIYWGTDIFSSFPCLKPVKRTTETAENWLITAETGGGKSFFVKGLLIQLLAKPTFNGTIMDIEGFEYIPLADYLSANDNVVILNMGEGTGAYYDPVEIVVTGNQELDADMYSLSSSFTLSLFKCLLGTTQSQDEWIDIVINDAVSLTYGKAGVDASDMSTWGNSAGFTLYDVYNTLKSLKSNGDAKRAISAMFTQSLWEEKQGIGQALSRNDVNRLITSNDGYQKAIDMCIAKISRYFEPNGIRAHLFRKRIAIDEIQDAKLVICSFGMAGKSPNTVDPIQMALMQLYSANISHLRSVFSKKAGKFNFKLWEEFQRWGGFPDADKTINVALTGGRKLGDVNIIVTNKVIDMLKDDKFGVFSNITSIAIGCIWDAEVREDLCNRLTIPQMKSELDTLVTNNKDLSAYIDGDTLMTNPYSKAFLIGLDKTVYTLSRMSIPKGLRDSHIFRTGVDLVVTKGEEN